MSQSLAERIRETSWNLMIQRIDGEPQLPMNPFNQTDLSFDYSKIDPKYHVSANSNDEIVLYKGAIRGYESKGLLSMALSRGLTSHIAEVKEIIEHGNDDLIRELFDEHTSYYNHTALLSATFNPEEAQVFAPTRSFTRKEDKTIYQLRIKTNRCVVDCYDTGNCGSGKELLILGAVFSEEISAVKIENDDQHSELLSPCGHYIRWHPDKNSGNRVVKDVSNWKYLR
ncbi:MAG: hypothetical protein HQ539_00045 [Parcubacteria group bacterium]|nr:hypothetical protein [Parcubacteria group bacterium]